MTATESKRGDKEIKEEIRGLAERFEKAPPEEVLRWALERFGEKVALATGFGAEGCVLVHLLAGIDPGARIFYLDTDLLFPETYALRERLQTRYGVRIRRQATVLSLDEQSSRYGERLWETKPDQCCRLRKVEPLTKTLEGLEAWITAIRRDQTQTRANAGLIDWDAKFGLVKINPLARWSSKDVWRYIFMHDIPYNPLHDKGFPSIGCRPCTAAVNDGEDERSGRWRGKKKNECGLHQ